MVEQAIGERLDGSPLSDKNAGKNPHAVALGKLGGAKGGAARAKALALPNVRRLLRMRRRAGRLRVRAERQSEVGAAFGQDLIDGVHESVPAIPVGDRLR